MQKAEETMQTIEEDMKEASAKLAAEQIDEVSKVRFTIKEVYKGEKWDDTCITAVITRWEEDSKKEKHVGGGGGYAFDDEGNMIK